MFKKILTPFFTRLSLIAAIIVVLFSCTLINQSGKGGKKGFLVKDSAKQTAETKAALENINSQIQWPHEKSDLLPDPFVVYGKLPNGFRYILMKNHRPKDRVSMHLDVQIGSMHESDNQQGLAHFLEHMLFDGSTHFKPGELVKYFQSIGMQFGPDANAHTGFNETVYDILMPYGDIESLEKGLTVLKDYAQGAL